MRNILLTLCLVAVTAWAADPLVGPGKVGEKDAKGHVKGANAGAGPHKHFKQQFERRVDTPEEAAEQEKKEKDEKAKKEQPQQQQAESKSR
jgi:hypothetical protein